MDRLFSPWRSKYIESFSHEKEGKEQCVLCSAHQADSDDEHRIVTRGKSSYVIMNLYPYNSGHLMIVPYRHLSELQDLTDDEASEMMLLVRRMTIALQKTSHPHGFNVGCNIGRSAGAGIADHIHFHVVPRWNGDTNFMPVLSDTKLISEDMTDTLHKLRNAIK